MVCENCLAPASNVQGALAHVCCATLVHCNPGYMICTQRYSQPPPQVTSYAELLTAHTRPFVRPASCTVEDMLQKQWM